MWPKPTDSPAITTKDTNEIKQALNEVREKVVAPIVPVSVNLSCERLMHIEGPIHRKFDIQGIVLTQRPRALRIDMGFFKPIPADASKVAAYFPFATSPWIYRCDLSNYETRTAFNKDGASVTRVQGCDFEFEEVETCETLHGGASRDRVVAGALTWRGPTRAFGDV